jgi:hypothetical protein
MLPTAVLLSVALLGSPAAANAPPAAPLPPNLPPEVTAALAAAAKANPAAAAPAMEEQVDPTAHLPPELVAPWQISMQFFTYLQRHDVEGVVAFSRAPFSFDGRPAATADDIKKGWARYLADNPLRHATLYGLEVLPYEEMVKRYGPVPAKLADLPLKGAVIAVANIDGRANLALLRKDPTGAWRVYAFSD